MNHLPNIEFSDHSLQEALLREQALTAKLQALALEHGLSWLDDSRAEAMRGQGAVALAGYAETYTALATSMGRPRLDKNKAASPEQFDQLLDAQLSQWAEPDPTTGRSTFDYLDAQAEADPGLRFTLVATPNVVVQPKDLMALATTFGKQQPVKTWILDNDFTGKPKFYQTYSPEELCGRPTRGVQAQPNPNGGTPLLIPTDPPVRFSLLPNKPTAELGVATVAAQRATLARLQATHPEAKLHVPSVLTNLTRWYTLRSQDSSKPELLTDSVFDETLVRHFDLEPKMVDGDLRVPYSFVYADGEPRLFSSYSEYAYSAVVAVG
jgi:hypothetical protein